MKLHSTQQGFTIIETLVAITILMIAIVGPLTIAHKGLLAAVYAHDQVTASYLAQDAIEYIKNIRDNNKLDGVDWLTNLRNCIALDPKSVRGFCTVDTVNGDSTDPDISDIRLVDEISPSECATECKLYLDSGGRGFVHGSGTATNFSRYFYLASTEGSDEVKIIVVVKWNVGLVANQVTYENQIYDISK